MFCLHLGLVQSGTSGCGWRWILLDFTSCHHIPDDGAKCKYSLTVIAIPLESLMCFCRKGLICKFFHVRFIKLLSYGMHGPLSENLFLGNSHISDFISCCNIWYKYDERSSHKRIHTSFRNNVYSTIYKYTVYLLIFLYLICIKLRQCELFTLRS